MNTVLGNLPMLDVNRAVASLKYKVKTANKTAAYTCTRADSGTHFTQSGGPVVFTLPAVATSTGCEYWFASLAGANDDLTVTAPAGTLVGFNNLGATSIAFPTNALIIGGIIHVVCNGSKWIATCEIGNILQEIVLT
jgi:hypothetical protein